ncbi:MAG: hypothetical protein AAGA68_13850 [Pseudomonadota bacterium]
MYRQLISNAPARTAVAVGLGASPSVYAGSGLPAFTNPDMLWLLALGIVALRLLRHLVLTRPRR